MKSWGKYVGCVLLCLSWSGFSQSSMLQQAVEGDCPPLQLTSLQWDEAAAAAYIASVGGTPLYTGVHSEIAWSPDGMWVAVPAYIDRQQGIQIWDVHTGDLITFLDPGTPEPQTFVEGNNVESANGVGMAWSPDARYIAAFYSDLTIRIWDASNQWQLKEISLEDVFVRDLVWSHNSGLLAYTNTHVGILHTQTGDVAATFPDAGYGSRILSNNDAWYLAANTVEAVKVYNIDTQKQILEIPHTSANQLIWTDDNGYLLTIVPNPEKNVVQIWEILSGNQVLRVDAQNVSFIASGLSKSGEVLLLATNRTARFIDVASGETVFTFEGQIPHTAPAWSPIGNCLVWVLAGADESMELVQVKPYANPDKITPISPPHDDEGYIVQTYAWSPDGMKLAVVADNQLSIYAMAQVE